MEFWKSSFTILNCLTLIDNAWTHVKYRTLNSEWKKLWSDSVAERDFEGFESDDSAFIDEVRMEKIWDSKWKVKMLMNI